MTPQEALGVSALVTALTQVAKWSGVPDRYGPVVVLLISALATALWAWDASIPFRGNGFILVSNAAQIALQAAGIFGFTRASASAVIALTSPPAGAGGDATTTVRAREDEIAPAMIGEHPVRCENCLRVIMRTDEEPELGNTLEGPSWSGCPYCKHKLAKPTVKRSGWIADRID